MGWRDTRHPPIKDLNAPGEVGFTHSVHKSRVRSDGELRIRPFQDLPQRREVVLCRMRDANRVESPIPLAIPCLTAATRRSTQYTDRYCPFASLPSALPQGRDPRLGAFGLEC